MSLTTIFSIPSIINSIHIANNLTSTNISINSISNSLSNLSINNISNSISTELSSVANNITVTVSAAAQQVVNTVVQDVTQLANNIQNYLTSTINTIEQDANAIYSSFVNFFNSIPNNITLDQIFSVNTFTHAVDGLERFVSAPLTNTAINPLNILHSPVGSTPSVQFSNLNLPQLSRLVTANNIENSIVGNKISNREVNITGVNNAVWHEPLSPYNSQYTQNHVHQTKNGIVHEIDDTPGAQRIHSYHPSGTYSEIDNNGTSVRKIVGDGYELWMRDKNVYIKGVCNVTIEGDSNVHIKNNCNLEIDGSLFATVKNDVSATVLGGVVVNAKENMIFKGNNIQFECNNFGIISQQNTSIQTGNYFTLLANNNIVLNSNTLFEVSSPTSMFNGQDFYVATNGFAFTGNGAFKFSGTPNIQAAGAGSIVYDNDGHNSLEKFLKVSDIDSNNNGKTPTQTSIIQLVNSSISTPPQSRAFPIAPEFNDIPINNKAVNMLIEVDDRPNGGMVSGTVQPPLYNNVSLTNTVVPVVGSNTSTLSTVDKSGLLNSKGISLATTLSKYCTLGDCSYNAAVSHYTVQDQAGLSEGQIVANLKYLAVNLIDKIYDKYGKGNVIITSAFRIPNDGFVSQHQTGQAVDLQFKDIPKSQYAARAAEIAANFVYDQLIFEYAWNGNHYTSWIHISVVDGKNRQQYATMNATTGQFIANKIINPFDNSNTVSV
jgi:hypothetical protein